jgi:hypothetical protein
MGIVTADDGIWILGTFAGQNKGCATCGRIGAAALIVLAGHKAYGGEEHDGTEKTKQKSGLSGLFHGRTSCRMSSLYQFIIRASKSQMISVDFVIFYKFIKNGFGRLIIERDYVGKTCKKSNTNFLSYKAYFGAQ